MTAQIKVKVQRKAIVKFKVLPRFPSNVVGDSNITVTKINGIWTISLNSGLTLDSPIITGDVTVNGAWNFTLTPTSSSTTAGAAAGPFFSTYRNNTAAADNLIGGYDYFGNNSTPVFFRYARLQAKIKDPTAVSEDAEWSVWTAVAGTLAERFTVGQGGYMAGVAGGDKGPSTFNATLYHNGTVLGTAALVNTGTSGSVVGLLNGNLTFSGSNSFSGLAAFTSQITSNAASHGNALINFLDASVSYGNIGAADNIITGGVVNYLGIYGVNGIEFGAVTNISRMKIITGIQVGVPTSGDKGLGTINLAGGAYVNNVAIPTISSADALSNKTSYNKVAITAPATSATLTILNGKTLTANNTLTLSGTDGSTLNMGTGGTLGTAAYVNTGTSGSVVGLLNANNTYSGSMVFSGLAAYTSQLTSNAASHGNAVINFLDNSVSYGNLGAADNVVSGGSATDFGFYASGSLNFGAGASNTSRVKITLGMFTSGATGGDKGANTFNASAIYLDGVRTGLTKVITFTRDLTAATGSVAYTGVGFKPTSLNATGGVGGATDYVLSGGFCDSALNQGNSGLVAGGGQVTSTAFIRAIDSTFGKVQSFAVTSMDSDGFTGTWTKTGLPTGTATYYVLCRC